MTLRVSDSNIPKRRKSLRLGVSALTALRKAFDKDGGEMGDEDEAAEGGPDIAALQETSAVKFLRHSFPKITVPLAPTGSRGNIAPNAISALVSVSATPYLDRATIAPLVEEAFHSNWPQVDPVQFVIDHFMRDDEVGTCERSGKPGLSSFYHSANLRAYKGGDFLLGASKTNLVAAMAALSVEMTGGSGWKKNLSEADAEYLAHASRERSTAELLKVKEVVPLDLHSSVAAVACGWNTSAVITSNGEVIISGARGIAAPVCLGNLTRTKTWSSQVSLHGIFGMAVLQVACGPHHFAAITACGQVVTWGANVDVGGVSSGISFQLGHDRQAISPPSVISRSLFESSDEVPISVACGWATTLVLTSGGLYSLGSNSHGQLARPSGQSRGMAVISSYHYADSDDCAIVSMACGKYFCAIVTSSGAVFGWGSNDKGQLGQDPAADPVIHKPTRLSIAAKGKPVQVACGAAHLCILTDVGELFLLGDNTFGQLGIGSDQPAILASFSAAAPLAHLDAVVVHCACGPYSSAAVMQNGEVYIWGMLADTSLEAHQYVPRLLETNGLVVTEVALGATHRLMVTDERLTETLQELLAASVYGASFNKPRLAELLATVPADVLELLQDRVSRSMQAASDKQPTVSVSPSSRLVYSSSSVRGNQWEQTRVLKVENTSGRHVQVSFVLQYKGDQAMKAKLDLVFTPNSFSLAKNQTQVVAVTMATSASKAAAMAILDASVLYAVVIKSKARKSRQFLVCSVASDETPCELPRTSLRCSSLVPVEEEAVPVAIMAELDSYLPSVLLSRFDKYPAPPTEPFIEPLVAATLFVDISGFTQLNEKLAQLGAVGPELVTKHINSYFSSLIEVVDEHGGDTLKFAGDALITMFTSSEESLADITLRATQCALVIQTRLAEYDSKEGFTLTLHVGIGAGKLYSLFVGGVSGSWEYMVYGEPLTQLRTCVDLSKAGEVVVSAEAWALIKDKCQGEQKPEAELGEHWVTSITDPLPEALPSPSSDKQLTRAEAAARQLAVRCFIPTAVQSKHDSHANDTWIDELRTATVMFVKLNSPISFDEADAFCKDIHDLLQTMQRIVFRFEGIVRQFLADDKGTVLIAAFGVPPHSPAGASSRCVRAALEIHAELKTSLHMDASVGVTTGRVFCGIVGSSKRREYAMVGDIVNLSARLMVAGGKVGVGILCDAVTMEAAKSNNSLSFKKLKSIKVKGKSEPIDVYEPSQSLGSRFLKKHTSPTSVKAVGRKKELQQLRRLFSPDSTHTKLLMEGEPGSGKTFLINKVTAFAKEKEYRLLATSMGSATNCLFFGCRGPLCQLLGLSSAGSNSAHITDASGTTAKLTKLLGASSADHFCLLMAVLPELKLPMTEAASAMNGSQRNARLAHMFVQLIQRGNAPTALVVEDVQYLDSGSIYIFTELLKRLPKLVVIMTGRLGRSLPPSFREMAALVTDRIKLEPLTLEQCKQMARNQLQVERLPDELTPILAAAQGSPLFCRELVSNLFEAGLLERHDGVVTVTKALSGADVPSSVQEIIAGRFDSLASQAQMVLKVAAVFGLEFHFVSLARVYAAAVGGASDKMLREALDLAVVGDFVLQNPVDPAIFYFCSDVLHQVAYRRLLFSQRRNLHRIVAEELEQEDAAGPASVLAHHWSEVVDGSGSPADLIATAKAVQYCKMAGDVAAVSQAKDEARALFLKATKLAKGLPKKERMKLEKELRLKMVGVGHKILRLSDMTAAAGASR